MAINRRWAFAAFVAIVLGMGGSFLPAQAEMVSTQQLLSHDGRAAQEAQARAFLDREDVRQQLQSLGVDPAEAKARVAALTDEELRKMSQTISTAPAPGDDDILIILGVIFIILVLLELLGVTHIFRRF